MRVDHVATSQGRISAGHSRTERKSVGHAALFRAVPGIEAMHNDSILDPDSLHPLPRRADHRNFMSSPNKTPGQLLDQYLQPTRVRRIVVRDDSDAHGQEPSRGKAPGAQLDNLVSLPKLGRRVIQRPGRNAWTKRNQGAGAIW